LPRLLHCSVMAFFLVAAYAIAASATPAISVPVPDSARKAITAAYSAQDAGISHRDAAAAMASYHPAWAASVRLHKNNMIGDPLSDKKHLEIGDRRNVVGFLASWGAPVSARTTIIGMTRSGETISVHALQNMKAAGWHPVGRFMDIAINEDRIDDWKMGTAGWKLIRSRNVAQVIHAEAPDKNEAADRQWAQQQGLEALPETFNAILSMTFSPDGRFLAFRAYAGSFWSGHHWSTHVWDLSGKVEVADLADDAFTANSIAFSPDGTMLAIGASPESITARPQGEITIIDTATWKQKARWQVPGTAVSAVVFTQDSRRVINHCGNGRFIVWDAVSGSRLSVFGVTDAAEISFDNYLAISKNGEIASTRGNFAVWNSITGKSIFSQDQIPLSAAWSPDGKTLAVDGESTRLPAFGSNKAGQILLFDTGNWQQTQTYTWPYPDESAGVIGWTPTGKTLILQSRNSIVALDVARRKSRMILDGFFVYNAALSPDGKLLAVVLDDEDKHLYLKKLSEE